MNARAANRTFRPDSSFGCFEANTPLSECHKSVSWPEGSCSSLKKENCWRSQFDVPLWFRKSPCSFLRGGGWVVGGVEGVLVKEGVAGVPRWGGPLWARGIFQHRTF